MHTTSIMLDEKLVEEAMRLGHAETQQEAVDLALREFISRHTPKNILDLVGEDLIDPDYDVRAVRAGMNRGLG